MSGVCGILQFFNTPGARFTYTLMCNCCLSEDHLKLKNLRENPNTFESAITTATNEQNVRRKVNLRTRHPYGRDEENMEVDHYRPVPRCFKCNRKGHRAKDSKAKTNVNAVENFNQNFTQNQTQERLCWHCNRKGHFKRDCRKRQSDLRSQGQEMERGGHVAAINQEN